MSLGRRLLMGANVGRAIPGQMELVEPGTYVFEVPPNVYRFSAVAIGAGFKGTNSSPFPAGSGGNLHWINDVPCTPGEFLTVQVGLQTSVTAESFIKRGSTYLVRAAGGQPNGSQSPTYHDALGGGGGRGGAGGPADVSSSGLGGGGPGYTGDGGRGGNYIDTSQGQMPDANSGGGRGGDRNGVPNGWNSTRGEGTGLLGRAPDRQSSLGTPRCGAGDWAIGTGLDGGVRIIWGGARSYPDTASDYPSSEVATFVSGSTGSGTIPQAVTFHGSGAAVGDLVLLMAFPGNGSVTAPAGWHGGGPLFWKQVTQDDLDASAAGTILLTGGDAPITWGCYVARGARVAAVRSQALADTSDITATGFTKRVDCKKVVAVVGDIDTATMGVPAGFTARVTRSTAPCLRFADIAPSAYVDGASVTFTGMGTSTAGRLVLVELF